MTEIPDWAVEIPSAPVHQEQPNQLVRPFTVQQLQEIGKELIEQLIKRVVLAVVGSFIPGPHGAAFDQLREWAEDIPVLGQLVEWLTGSPGDELDLQSWAQNLLGPNSPLNAFNIIGQLLPRNLGGVSLSSLGTFVPNLLQDFISAASVPNVDGWSWDSTVGTPGSAKVVANGTAKTLYGDLIPVSEDQPLDTEVKVQYFGVVSGAGQTIQYVLETFTNTLGTGTPVTVVIGGVTNPTGSAGPVTLGNPSWTPPAGVLSVRPVLKVASAVSAGSVHFMNPSLEKPLLGVLQDGLGAAIQARIDEIQDILDAFADGVGGTIQDLLDRIQNLVPGTGLVDAAGLTNIAGIPIVPNTKVSGIGGATNLGAALGETIDKAVQGAANLAGQTGFSFDDLFASLDELRHTTAATSAAVAALQSDSAGQTNSGFSFNDNFGNDPDLSTPPTIYTKIEDTGSGSVVTVGGTLDWSGGAVVGRELYLYTVEPLLTDYFESSMVMPRRPGFTQGWFGSSTGENYNYLLGRSNLAGTTLCFARVGFNTIRVGCINAGSTTMAAPTWFGNAVSYTIPAGAKVTFRGGTAGGLRIFQVLVNDVIRATFTDTGVVSVANDTHRYCGFGMQADSSYLPGNMALWAMNDNSPTPTLGSGFRVYRNNTAGASIASGTNKLPNSFFDTVQRISPDGTFNGANNNGYTIGKAGWWLFELRCNQTNTLADDDTTGLVLFKGANVCSRSDVYEVPFLSGSGSLDTTHRPSATFLVYCDVGDVIHPGSAVSSTRSFVGDSTGTNSYFTGARLGTV